MNWPTFGGALGQLSSTGALMRSLGLSKPFLGQFRTIRSTLTQYRPPWPCSGSPKRLHRSSSKQTGSGRQRLRRTISTLLLSVAEF
jgi:hypothetical protein